MLTFRKHYFFFAVLIFSIEVLIAMFLHDGIIRPYIGDLLVVMLIYCFVRSFLKLSVVTAAIGTLMFAYLIEFLQYLKLVQILGLQKSKIPNLVLGNFFEWMDMLAYTLGIALVLVVERSRSLKLNSPRH
jgi:hypothetical protein